MKELNPTPADHDQDRRPGTDDGLLEAVQLLWILSSPRFVACPRCGVAHIPNRH